MKPGSELSKFSRIVLDLYRDAQELPVDRFQDAAFERLKPAIPFDAAIWGTATMTPAGIDVHSLHTHRFPDDMMAAFLRVRHQDSAAMRVTQHARMTIGFSAAEEFTGEDQEEIRQFARDYSQHHCFVTSDIHPVTRFVHWISLFRSDPQRPCLDEEVHFLSELGPHLMQAVAINRLVHLDRMLGDAARDCWSVAIADARGVLYHSDARFLELVLPEWPLAQHERLALALVRQLQAGDGQVIGRSCVLQCAKQQGLLFLKARARHEVDALSARELVVAQLLTAGMTHKQIARHLDRSPETVRTQIKSIFEKLGINNVALLPSLLALRQ
ncbi:MAG: transcriptional regulator, LuxR family [Ramlibacter sp.]|jgi:DNA-binding CsgD family transcriptional regulator|nr:transcriptional regulator, LuxR family [Ramlibacter sp.]